MSGRECNYASHAGSENVSTLDTFPYEQSISPGDNHNQGNVSIHAASPYTDASPSNSALPELPNISDHQNVALHEAINLSHMELLIHLINDKEIFNLGLGDTHLSSISFGLKLSLEFPYLLHQSLAFSARRLAFLHPERAAFYLHEAVSLQTRAVSLFNAAFTEVNRSNCVAILLFSAVLGHHLLADTLAKRDLGELEAFMSYYMQCLEMHRGIYTIATTAWPLLMESELEPILSLSSNFHSRVPRGNDCQRIGELVDGADGLDEEGKEACRMAIQYLQVGFDAMFAQEEHGKRYNMIFSWALLVPPEFTRLLAARRPEALAVLGYYALLLHYGRNMWQVRDSGTYILGIVVDYLGPEWHHWLESPRERVAQDLE